MKDTHVTVSTDVYKDDDERNDSQYQTDDHQCSVNLQSHTHTDSHQHINTLLSSFTLTVHINTSTHYTVIIHTDRSHQHINTLHCHHSH